MSAKKRKKADGGEQRAKLPDTSMPASLADGARFFWAVSAFLLLALLVYFREFIFDGDAILLGSDMITQALQTRKIGVDQVKAGEGYPLWNPFSYCGIPYIGGLPGPMFYPLTALYYILPLYRAIGWTFLLMMLFGGMFCYLWIRELGLGKAAAGLCAVAFGFTGWVASGLNGGHDGRMFVILLTPLVFFFAERGFNRGKLVYFLLMGAAVACQILSPMVQMMYYGCLGLTAYAVWRLALAGLEAKSVKPAIRLGLMYAAGFALAVSLSAIQFGPTLANQDLTHRQAESELGYGGWEHATSFSMHPTETMGLVVPGFTGEPESYWSAEGFKGHSEYMGLLVVLFAVVAWARRRNREVWFFTGLGAVALLWNFGGYTPFFHLPYNLLPVVKSFRAPNMMFFVFAFSLITIAGYGLDHVLNPDNRPAAGDRESDPTGGGMRVLLYCLAALVAILLVLGVGRDGMPQFLTGLLPDDIGRARLPVLQQYYGRIIQAAFVSAAVGGAIVGLVWLWSRRIISLAVLVAILAVLTWADLMRMDRHWLSVGDVDDVYYADKLVDHLQPLERSEHRVYFYPSPIIRAGYRDYWDNSLLYFKIPTVNASMPLRLQWFEQLYGTHTQRNLARDPRLWESIQGALENPPDNLPNTIHHRFWNLMAADFIMFRKSQLTQFFEREYPFLEKVVEDERSGRVLYRNPGAWDRYRLFGAFEVIEDGNAVIDRINDPAFDPASTLILNERPEFDAGSLPGAGEDIGTVEKIRHGYDGIELRVDLSSPALLYFAESYHPFWRATVDGAPAKVYRANLGMRAVHLPSGSHEVIMRYVSAPYQWGKRLTALAILVLLGFVGLHAYRKDW